MTNAEKTEKLAQLQEWLTIAQTKQAAAEKLARTAKGAARRQAYDEASNQAYRARSFRQQLNVLAVTRTQEV